MSYYGNKREKKYYFKGGEIVSNKKHKLIADYSVNKDVSNEDTRFLNVTIDVLHTGVNLNGSAFTKEVVDKCIETIKNTPILGFIAYDKSMQGNDFNGHEYILTKTENGIEEKYIGRAYGVIPESCNPRWFTKISSDGQEREYLQVDALLWQKFSDCIDIMDRDGIKSQSMELDITSFDGTEDENGIFNFTDFKFDGCCILGSTVEPAMIDANVQVSFSMSDFVNKLHDEIKSKYNEFVQLTETGKKDKEVSDDMPETNFQTINSLIEDVRNILRDADSFIDRWGDTCYRYAYVDMTDKEIIYMDRKNGYQYYGASYTISGDKPIIDFDTAKRKTIAFVDYVEPSEPDGTNIDNSKYSIIQEISDNAFEKYNEVSQKLSESETKKSEIETDYNNLKAELDQIKPKYEEYVRIEAERAESELIEKKNEIFVRFESVLKDNADFISLRDNSKDLTVDEVESKLSVIYAKQTLSTNFTKKEAPAKVRIFTDDADDGFIVSKRYGNIPVKKN